ncbi:putative E3 ubiquitin-protein ligase RF298 [Iris pallida]|uniref:E3 ubiquitin-protein ligase RF298 n=1 Tax=Iris pallida TaxID=29817 RepID=A0AAX6EFD7_IRIPA|nr:putative E3 ubiquitin-protein ligase RF298 [Iris pallida]
MAAMVARGSSPLAPSSSIPEKGSRNKRKFAPTRLSVTRTRSRTPRSPICPTTSCSRLINPRRIRTRAPLLRCVSEPCLRVERGGRAGRVSGSRLERLDRDATRRDGVEQPGDYIQDRCQDDRVLWVRRGGRQRRSEIGGLLRLQGHRHEHRGECAGGFEERAGVGFPVGWELRGGVQKLGRSVLAEMVNVLLEMRPSFSVGNAMWCLLISDMNVTHACAMDCNTLGSMGSRMISASSVASQAEQESNSSGSSSQTMLEANTSGQSKPNPSLHCPQNITN